MPIFMMFGKYDKDSLNEASKQGTKKTISIIEKNGGMVISMYAIMGEYDLVVTLDFQDAEKIMSASLTLKMQTGISFSTSPVVEVEKFDHLIDRIEKI